MIELVIDGCTVWKSETLASTGVRESITEGITEARQVVEHFEAIRNLQQEAFAVLALDGGNKPKGPAKIVTLGLLNSNQVHPREVFADAIADRAASIIVAHNHPSGALNASPEDIAITKRLKRAGTLLGLPLLDHIILSPGGGFLSMRSAGHC